MKCHTSHNSGIWRCFCAVALLLTLASATCANAQTTPTYYAAACGTGGGTAGTICLAGTGATPEAAAAPVAKGVDNFMVNTYDSPNGNGTAATSYYQVSNSTYQGCHLQNQAPPAGVGGNFCGFHWTMQPTELCQNYLANQCVPETPTNMGETVLVTVTTTAPKAVGLRRDVSWRCTDTARPPAPVDAFDPGTDLCGHRRALISPELVGPHPPADLSSLALPCT